MQGIHGTNTTLVIWDSAGASQNVSGDLNSVDLDWSRDNPNSTTFGQNTTQRIAGIRDYTLSVAAIFNNGASSAASAISQAIAGSYNVLFKWYPVPLTTGCEFWTGCALPSSYKESANLSGPVAVSFTLQAGSGSLSGSTV